MKIYTRKGDRGQTGILGGGRLSKSDARIRALGGLDEANAVLGVVLAGPVPGPELREALLRCQRVLFEAGAAVASHDATTGHDLFLRETAWLESEIDRVEATLSPLTRFILPGGSPAGAGLHWARTVVRRAETALVEAAGHEEARLALLAWLNRLSDALFVFARQANHLGRTPETVWESEAKQRPKAPASDRGGFEGTEPPSGRAPQAEKEGRTDTGA